MLPLKKPSDCLGSGCITAKPDITRFSIHQEPLGGKKQGYFRVADKPPATTEKTLAGPSFAMETRERFRLYL